MAFVIKVYLPSLGYFQPQQPRKDLPRNELNKIDLQRWVLSLTGTNVQKRNIVIQSNPGNAINNTLGKFLFKDKN